MSHNEEACVACLHGPPIALGICAECWSKAKLSTVKAGSREHEELMRQQKSGDN